MDTIEKYKHYVNPSMFAGIVPVVFDHADGAIVFGEAGTGNIVEAVRHM